MALELKLSLSVGLVPSGTDGTLLRGKDANMTDEAEDFRDWAGNALRQIEKRRGDERLRDQKLIAEQEIKKQQVPPLWAQVRTAMKAMCDALNKQAGEELLKWDSVRSNEAIIRLGRTSKTISAAFDPESLTLEINGVSVHGRYSPSVRNGQVFFAGSEGEQSPRQIAQRFIDPLVKLIP